MVSQTVLMEPTSYSATRRARWALLCIQGNRRTGRANPTASSTMGSTWHETEHAVDRFGRLAPRYRRYSRGSPPPDASGAVTVRASSSEGGADSPGVITSEPATTNTVSSTNSPPTIEPNKMSEPGSRFCISDRLGRFGGFRQLCCRQFE